MLDDVLLTRDAVIYGFRLNLAKTLLIVYGRCKARRPTIFRVADLRQAFGRRVRQLRRASDLSQEEFADRARLHPTYVSGIERGHRNPSLVIIGRIAHALSVSLSDLFANVQQKRVR